MPFFPPSPQRYIPTFICQLRQLGRFKLRIFNREEKKEDTACSLLMSKWNFLNDTGSWSLSHNSSCWLVEREIDSVRLSRLVLMLHSFSFVKWVLGQGLYHSPKFKYCILKIPGEDREGEKVSTLHHRHPWDLGN